MDVASCPSPQPMLLSEQAQTTCCCQRPSTTQCCPACPTDQCHSNGHAGLQCSKAVAAVAHVRGAATSDGSRGRQLQDDCLQIAAVAQAHMGRSCIVHSVIMKLPVSAAIAGCWLKSLARPSLAQHSSLSTHIHCMLTTRSRAHACASLAMSPNICMIPHPDAQDPVPGRKALPDGHGDEGDHRGGEPALHPGLAVGHRLGLPVSPQSLVLQLTRSKVLGLLMVPLSCTPCTPSVSCCMDAARGAQAWELAPVAELPAVGHAWYAQQPLHPLRSGPVCCRKCWPTCSIAVVRAQAQWRADHHRARQGVCGRHPGQVRLE